MNDIAYLKYLPYFIVLFLILITRRNQQKQLQMLTEKEQNMLNKSLTGYRIFQYIIIVLVLIPVFVFQNKSRVSLIAIFTVEALIIISWFTCGHFLIKKKLSELELPEAFIRFHLLDRLLLSFLLLFLIAQFYLGPIIGF